MQTGLININDSFIIHSSIKLLVKIKNNHEGFTSSSIYSACLIVKAMIEDLESRISKFNSATQMFTPQFYIWCGEECRTDYNELVDDCPAVGTKADELS
jgi:hypothetical protein